MFVFGLLLGDPEDALRMGRAHVSKDPKLEQNGPCFGRRTYNARRHGRHSMAQHYSCPAQPYGTARAIVSVRRTP